MVDYLWSLVVDAPFLLFSQLLFLIVVDDEFFSFCQAPRETEAMPLFI